MGAGSIIALVGGGVALVGSILIGTGQVASKSELKEVEVTASTTRAEVQVLPRECTASTNRAEVHVLKTEQAVMKRDIAHIRGAVETLRTSQDANFQTVIEKLGDIKRSQR